MTEAEKTRIVTLSPLDEERFGIKSARATINTAADFPEVLEFCRAEGVVFLIARCPTGNSETVHLMEQNGFKLMDTLVYYDRDLTNTQLPPVPNNITVGTLRAGEEREVEKVAAKAFQNFVGHYHTDPRLDKRKADEVYSSWAMRCCASRKVAEVVIIAKYDGKIVGFYALKLTPDRVVEGVLAGVDPSAQGLKVGRALITGGLEWGLAAGAPGMSIATQLINTKMQRVLLNLRFEPVASFYTFHKWFDE